MRPSFPFAFAVSVALTVHYPSSALACGTYDECPPLTARGLEGPIPANTPLLLMSGLRDLGAADITVFEGAADDAPVFEAWQLVATDDWPTALQFDAELSPDVTYRISVDRTCADVPNELEFEVGPSAPLPDSLGTLSVEVAAGPIQVFDAVICEPVDMDAVVGSVSIEWSEGAEPWRHLLQWTTLVDGETTSFPTGWGLQNIYAHCDGGYGGLAEGSYLLSASAELPGTDLVLETSGVEVALSCELAPAPTPTPIEEDDPVLATDSPLLEGDELLADDSAQVASDEAPGSDDPVIDAEAAQAGGCRMTTGSTSGFSGWFLLAVLPLFRRRVPTTHRPATDPLDLVGPSY